VIDRNRLKEIGRKQDNEEQLSVDDVDFLLDSIHTLHIVILKAQKQMNKSTYTKESMPLRDAYKLLHEAIPIIEVGNV